MNRKSKQIMALKEAGRVSFKLHEFYNGRISMMYPAETLYVEKLYAQYREALREAI